MKLTDIYAEMSRKGYLSSKRVVEIVADKLVLTELKVWHCEKEKQSMYAHC